MRSWLVTGTTAGAPRASPAIVTCGPVSGSMSSRKQRNAYVPEPRFTPMGWVVSEPIPSTSAYTAPLAGLTRSTSASSPESLAIVNVCGPAAPTCQRVPQWSLFTRMAPAGADGTDGAEGAAEQPASAATATATARAASGRALRTAAARG